MIGLCAPLPIQERRLSEETPGCTTTVEQHVLTTGNQGHVPEVMHACMLTVFSSAGFIHRVTELSFAQMGLLAPGGCVSLHTGNVN